VLVCWGKKAGQSWIQYTQTDAAKMPYPEYRTVPQYPYIIYMTEVTTIFPNSRFLKIQKIRLFQDNPTRIQKMGHSCGNRKIPHKKKGKDLWIYAVL